MTFLEAGTPYNTVSFFFFFIYYIDLFRLGLKFPPVSREGRPWAFFFFFLNQTAQSLAKEKGKRGLKIVRYQTSKIQSITITTVYYITVCVCVVA